jgi:hypothetical protein
MSKDLAGARLLTEIRSASLSAQLTLPSKLSKIGSLLGPRLIGWLLPNPLGSQILVSKWSDVRFGSLHPLVAVFFVDLSFEASIFQQRSL